MVPKFLAVEAPERFGVEPVGWEGAPYPEIDFGGDFPLEGDYHCFGFGTTLAVLPDCVVDVGQIDDDTLVHY